MSEIETKMNYLMDGKLFIKRIILVGSKLFSEFDPFNKQWAVQNMIFKMSVK